MTSTSDVDPWLEVIVYWEKMYSSDKDFTQKSDLTATFYAES